MDWGRLRSRLITLVNATVHSVIVLRAVACPLGSLVAGSFLLVVVTFAASADVVISGFHGIRIYNEQTGAFMANVQTGEEQEGIAFGRDGRLYALINDMGGGWISRYASGSYTREGGFGPHDFTGMPMGMALGPDGNLYVGGANAFGMEGGIRRLDGKTGKDLGVFVPTGDGGLGLGAVLVFGPDGNLYVSNWGDSKVMRFDGTSGEFRDDFISPGSGGLEEAAGLVFGADGDAYVSSGKTSEVLRFDGASGAFLDKFVSAGSGGLAGPAGLAFGPDGNLYVCSRGNNSVRRYDGETGAFIDTFIPSGSGGLDNGPNYIAFTPRAPKLNISQTARGLVVHWEKAAANCVLEGAFEPSGAWQTLATSEDCLHLIRADSSAAAICRFFRLRQE